MKSKYFIIMLLFVAGLAYGNDNVSGRGLREYLVKNKDVAVLDVRNPEELNGELGKLENVINIPLHQLESRLSELKNIKDKTIVVICRSGRRSGIATEFLKSKGFDAINVTGGMIEYRSKE